LAIVGDEKKLDTVDMSLWPKEVKVKLLEALGFGASFDGYVLKHGKRVFDLYTDEPVRVDNMNILPGPAGIPVILNDNLLSLAEYFEDYGEDGRHLPADFSEKDRETIRKYVKSMSKGERSV